MRTNVISEVSNKLSRIPRERIGFFPTPFHSLDNISKELGIHLYLKRDDLTGPATFGGNKVRKLEFLLADAKKSGAEYVITYGATQSNHAMLTATASLRAGFKPILFLTAVVPPNLDDLRANFLLDHILGAEVHVIPMLPGMTMADAAVQRAKAAESRIAELEAQGHRCYDIPAGGASPLGGLGFVSGYVELMDQIQKQGLEDVDYIVHSSGSGGTLAGLTAGRALVGSKATILSFASGLKASEYSADVASMANSTLAILGSGPMVKDDDIRFDMTYVGDGYEVPTDASTSAIRFFAQREGVFFDPVYTSKALAAMLDYIKLGKIGKGSTVVFWHTGGTTALFSEQAIVGKIYG